jgi:hypothetical protein
MIIWFAFPSKCGPTLRSQYFKYEYESDLMKNRSVSIGLITKLQNWAVDDRGWITDRGRDSFFLPPQPDTVAMYVIVNIQETWHIKFVGIFLHYVKVK